MVTGGRGFVLKRGCFSPAMYTTFSSTTNIMSPLETSADSSNQDEEPKGTKRKISLSNCGICGTEEAKYKCPACLTHSCSLICVKKHKDESRCSGVRNKTAYLTLSQFDEMTLLSDYRFLEDTGRFADGAHRDLIRVPRASMRAKKLTLNARKMNITLRTLPSTFTKSIENSTIFHFREKRFLWHLKIMFPQSGTEFSQIRVCDRLTLEHILTPYIHPTESDPVMRQKLKRYVEAPIEDVSVFMKAEGRKANSVRYHKLDIHKSLKDNLIFKILIEYPVLHVVLRAHWKEFPLKGPAEPASACDKFATKSEAVDQASQDQTESSSCMYGSHTTGGNTILTATQSSPETEPPQNKRAKIELEDGEIMDSDDEDERRNTGENTTLMKISDGANSPAHSMDVNKDELVDSEDKVEDNCVNKDASTVDDRGAARESLEVGMTENAMKGPLFIHHRPDENQSVNITNISELQ
ncbi:box C/D snoRNA protein 1 [Dunckerocampus dactyliophorus]|uniref:box C/D snoRNA protein 1 n=1 Tax=Dunckerocampus dactyliophorus TaxID=161453 RepID=UPI002404F4A9|nr:box C/D snoRNA protein 1 [Dunckerocampus dactyliophorus]